MTKRGSSFGYKSSHTHKGRVSIRDFVIGEVSTMRDVVRILVSFLFLSILDTLFMYLKSCDYVVIANLVLVDIYTFEVVITVLTPISPCVVSFLSLYTCFLYNVCNLIFCFTRRWLDEFCSKCFRNTSCQSLLAINYVLAKFFKSLC